MTELDPDVANDVPWSDSIGPYDEQHFVTYLRLLDAVDGVPTGKRWRGSSCTAIRRPSRTGHGAAGTHI